MSDSKALRLTTAQWRELDRALVGHVLDLEQRGETKRAKSARIVLARLRAKKPSVLTRRGS